MSEDEEKERGFKVADRRRFSSEGELKSDQAEEPPAAAQPQSSDKPAQGGPSAGAQAQASAAYEKASAADERDLGPQEITFASFVVGLSTEALALLGEMPHPATGERIKDLVGAQQIIDIIALLRDKTRGNLSRDEDALLEAILFDLRMKYVEKARPTHR
ncbi:MAG TPA: DUF1844 domain-containing protein [Candidatus Binataceae bacterium]|nr:DUF1844 domain-containing protein [Candidatus Binataceae bacterium]